MGEPSNAAVKKYTAADIGILDEEEDGGSLELDLGNLAVYDYGQLDAHLLKDDPEAACYEAATRMTQALVKGLWQLPTKPADRGRIASLPEPKLKLPREKPLPKPKEPTKWEKFAQEKGIRKRKKQLMVWDEVAGEWRRRYGYKKAGDIADVAIIDAKPSDKPGDDPFLEHSRQKRQRVKEQKEREVANLARADKAGRLPATVRLAQSLEQGNKPRGKQLKNELSFAQRAAGVSTASVGKFDRKLKGEGVRKLPGTKRKFAPNIDPTGGVDASTRSLADKVIRERSDDIVDVSRAMGKLDAARRQARHQAKQKDGVDNASKKGAGGGKKRGKGQLQGANKKGKKGGGGGGSKGKAVGKAGGKGARQVRKGRSK